MKFRTKSAKVSSAKVFKVLSPSLLLTLVLASLCWESSERATTNGAGSAFADAPQPFVVRTGIVYVDGGHVSQSLDVISPLPDKDINKARKKYPVIVFIHGGGWSSGSKNDAPKNLVQEGFAVVSINYRLVDQAKFPAQIYDCKAAIRWIRAHGAEYNLDTRKIGVWGASAGGHLAALLGTTNGVKSLEGSEGNLDKSSDVQAVCDFYGPTDLAAVVNYSDYAHSAILAFLGGTDAALTQRASPVTYVTGKVPPFLIVHGDKDNLVPIAQSKILADRLKKVGADVTFRTVVGGGHGENFVAADFQAVNDFFNKHLK